MKHFLKYTIQFTTLVILFFSMTQPVSAAKGYNPAIDSVLCTDGKSAQVTWTKKKNATGYQLQYATNAKFKKAKRIKVKGINKITKKINGLSSHKDIFIRVRAYKKNSQRIHYLKWSEPARIITWKRKWKYAGNSAIHTGKAVLFYSNAAKKKNITVCVNAGHGTRGGTAAKTLCHPNGSAKVTGGSTAAGAKYATAVSSGTTLYNGLPEYKATLNVAKITKKKLLKAGYNVLMIRQTDDVQLDNVARTVIANHYADCHIAIHYDSSGSDKGAFAITVPNVASYKNMEPVKSYWKKHNRLASNLISGLKKTGVKICGNGTMAIDLTQTSYSTIPSVDIEVGDRASSTASPVINKIAEGLIKGIDIYFKK